jgi:hypothetical protein
VNRRQMIKVVKMATIKGWRRDYERRKMVKVKNVVRMEDWRKLYELQECCEEGGLC